jgi:hypothetical protein
VLPDNVGVPEAVKVMGWQPVVVKVPLPLKVTPLLAMVLIFQLPIVVTLAYKIIVTPLAATPWVKVPLIVPELGFVQEEFP